MEGSGLFIVNPPYGPGRRNRPADRDVQGAAMIAFHTLDVFTETPFAGNPLAVVLGADG
jgi:hypothetical protein